MKERDSMAADAPLSPELRGLVQRLSQNPRGLGFLHLAPLDTIAIVLGVDPFVVDRARAMLETKEGRARLIVEMRKARKGPPVLHPSPVEPGPHALPPADTVDELIRRAEEHPLGLRFLMDAPLETVAITLGSSVLLVFDAREFLRDQRGLESNDGEEEEP